MQHRCAPYSRNSAKHARRAPFSLLCAFIGRDSGPHGGGAGVGPTDASRMATVEIDTAVPREERVSRMRAPRTATPVATNGTADLAMTIPPAASLPTDPQPASYTCSLMQKLKQQRIRLTLYAMSRPPGLRGGEGVRGAVESFADWSTHLVRNRPPASFPFHVTCCPTTVFVTIHGAGAAL